jgi:carbonic anhydrase
LIVIIVGHTLCNASRIALKSANADKPKPPTTSVERWLVPLVNLAKSLELPDNEESVPILIEASVRKQVQNVAQSQAMQVARKNNTNVEIHGWIYDLETGILEALDVSKDALA